jgi:peptide/nickel transport system permease protein
MLRYALRRTLWAIPTLFGISLVAFFVTTLIPDPTAGATDASAALLASDPLRYDAVEEQRRVRFLELPPFFNPHPRDVRVRAEEALLHVVNDDGLAQVGARELVRLGGAALPYVLPRLDNLAPPARARVAVALQPVAERMGEKGAERLHDPAQAVLYWSRFWEDRSLDFTEPAVKRAVHRLVIHSSDLRERDLLGVDTFALPALIPQMAETDDREALRKLAALASHVTGRSREIPFDADDRTLRRVVFDWEAWWQAHESDFVALDGVARVAGTLTETRYGKWVLGAATGKLGLSVRDGEPIAQKLRARAPVTLALTLLALLVSYALAVPIGALSAWWRGRAVDTTVAVALFAMYSFPTFWAAQLLARTYGPMEAGELGPVGFATFGTWVHRLAAPVCALSLGSLATLSRYQRAATLDVIRQDYVRAAQAKGASSLRIVVVHALRNAMIPTVTLAGLQFPALLGGAFVVEEVFGVPGLGYETLRAVEAHDAAWLVSTMLLTAVVTTVALIASDLAYGALDPRVRDTMGRRRGGLV